MKAIQQILPALFFAALLVSCATVAEGPRKSPSETLVAPHRAKAAELAGAGRLRDALEIWKVALTIDPKDPVSLEESKKLEERIEAATAERLSRGQEALKRGAHLDARGHFLAVLALDPSNRDAFTALQQQVREVRQANHTVRAGESLASIAQSYYGDRSRSEVIWETNQLPPNPKLSPGMMLRIPEIPGLPFGRPEAPVAKPRPDAPVPTQLSKLSPRDTNVTSLLSKLRGRLVQQHYNQGIRRYREEKLPAAIGEWRTVLQYEPNHEGAKKNIQTAEQLLKGLQERQQKQTR